MFDVLGEDKEEYSLVVYVGEVGQTHTRVALWGGRCSSWIQSWRESPILVQWQLMKWNDM